MPLNATHSHKPLRQDRPLLHEEGACLPLRSRHGTCRACMASCPVEALHVGLEGVSLSDACTGCGRCTSVCPTEALQLPELLARDVQAPLPTAETPVVRFECRKVPMSQRLPGTVEWPCLGAVRPSHILAQIAAGTSVQVMDRGWCNRCAVAGPAAAQAPHPAEAALEAAGLWLTSLGLDAPALVRAPLPTALDPGSLPVAPTHEPAVDRRRFFREALDRPAGRPSSEAPTPMGGNGRAAHPAELRPPSPDRVRLLRAMQHLAERTHQALPPELFPRIEVRAGCNDQRLCVALCPTQALTTTQRPDSAQLLFESTRCLGCGTCTRACPEGALTLEAVGGQPEQQTLITHRSSHCRSCGVSYRPEDGSDTGLCPGCTKSQRFMADARQQLFGF